MTSRFLVIGDVHIKVDNIPEIELFSDKIIVLAKERQLDGIILLGDILHYHEKLHTVCLNKACYLIDKLREISELYIIVGNHDMISASTFLNENHWMNVLKDWENVHIIDTSKEFIHNNHSLIMVPFVPNGRFEEALNTLEKDWKNTDIIFCHQEFKGCKMGAIISESGDTWPLEYPYIIAGHIHSHQIPQDNIYYTGSCMQHAFGESEKNIVIILTLNNHERKIEEIDLGLPRKKIVYTDVDKLENYEYDEENKDQIKLTVSGTVEEFKTFKKSAKYKELSKKGAKIVYKPRKIEEEEEITENEFDKILYDLIVKDKDMDLMNAYNYVVHKKEEEELYIF